MNPLLLASLCLTVAFATPTLNWKSDTERQLAPSTCNLNLCFALDGSGSVTSNEFEIQKNLILDVAAILSVDNPGINYAAVQYGVSIQPVTPLTGNIEDFILKIDGTTHLRAGASFVAGGINYCADQLLTRKGQANQIVLFTDGRANQGGSPVLAANRFRDAGGHIAAVITGFGDKPAILDIVGGNSALVLQEGDLFGLIDILGQLFTTICGTSLS